MIALKLLHVQKEISQMVKNIQGTPTSIKWSTPVKHPHPIFPEWLLNRGWTVAKTVKSTVWRT